MGTSGLSPGRSVTRTAHLDDQELVRDYRLAGDHNSAVSSDAYDGINTIVLHPIVKEVDGGIGGGRRIFNIIRQFNKNNINCENIRIQIRGLFGICQFPRV